MIEEGSGGVRSDLEGLHVFAPIAVMVVVVRLIMYVVKIIALETD